MFSGLDFARQSPARRWTALISFTVQAGIVLTVLLLPLLYPNGLPEALVPRKIFVPISAGDTRAEPSHARTNPASTAHLMPLVVSHSSFVFHPTESQPDATGQTEAPPIGITDSGSDVINSIVSESYRPMPSHAAIAVPIRISRMMEGNLIHRVEPQYPTIAKTAGISGPVVIKAIISRSGSIEQATAISGQPMLTRAALEAVRQWKYRPYILNTEPVEVETQITVNFVLR